jgi:serine/threonine protein kinase
MKWSLGVILYNCLTREMPFNGESFNDIKVYNSFNTQIKVISGKFRILSRWDSELINLIKSLLEPNMKKRLTMEKLLRNNWVQKDYDTKKVSSSGYTLTDDDVNNKSRN